MTEVCNSVTFDEEKLDYLSSWTTSLSFRHVQNPGPLRMREGGSLSGTMGQARQCSAQLCKINQLLTRLGPLFA